jgi:hypothetical protein
VDGARIAYDVAIRPAGHVLVAADDELPPVLLYSDVSSFDAARIADRRTIEAWIVPEAGRRLARVRARARSRPAGTRPEGWQQSATGRAWRRLAPSGAAPSSTVGATEADREPTVGVVGPLLSSSWAQGGPYNNYTPAAGACAHTVTGCTATAMAQLMRYWEWPPSGIGSNAYAWDDDGSPSSPPVTLSAVFEHPYDWGSMPDSLTSSSPSAQIDAVARLCSDAGVAVDMDYGCSASGGSDTLAAMFALPNYFRYQVSSGRYSRADHTTEEFFGRIQEELDASPRRPLLFVVWSIGVPAAGHTLIIDGYQVNELNEVHLNFGWGGSYQGWYTIDEDWTAAYTWDAENQWVYPGIQPLPPSCTFTLAASGASVSAAGGLQSFTMGSQPGCTWAARAASLDADWLIVTIESETGSGDGVVQYYVHANDTALERTGTVRAAGKVFTVTQAGVGAPGPFLKTSPPSGATQVYPSSARLYWGASASAASYEYCVDTTDDDACGTSWSSTTARLVSLALTPGATFYWQVRAVNAAGTAYANDGAWWSFSTVPAPVFTDDPLVPGVTAVKAAHVLELRARVNELRQRQGLAAYPWTDPVLPIGVVTVKAVHLLELRNALAGAYTAAGRTPPTYSTPAPAQGMPIGALHISELRAAIVAAW